MPDDIRVNLVFDPYRISRTEGDHVCNAADELRAFREIAVLLRRDPAYETVNPKTYVIESSWEHFRAYSAIHGVRLHIVSPRIRVREHFHTEPPDWLTDEVIADCNLLECSELPTSLINDDWALTIGSCVFPGVAEAASLDQFVTLVASTSVPMSWGSCPPLVEWLTNRFVVLAKQVIPSPDIVFELRDILQCATSPSAFAREWIKRRALLPLLRHDLDKPLSAPELPSESVRNLVLAAYVPQVFPLPGALHAEVSELMRRAVQRTRIESPDAFEATVLHLNALWDGIPDELGVWLDLRPRALTAQAIHHLRSMAGFEASVTAQRLVAHHAPPDPVSPWSGLDDGFDSWVVAYSNYVDRVFFRRELPEQDVDPAMPFGRWLKDNSTVLFNHPERGYRYVARVIQEAIQRRRCVVVVLMDALAIQLAQQATGYLADACGSQPTQATFIFAPLPTITEVCKEAILTGQLPSQCQGNLSQSLLRTYGLTSDQMQLAGNWQDAERLQFTRQTRLVVYRDNRIDDQLKTSGTYKVLVEECPAVLSRVARLVQRWVRDLTHLHDSSPLLLLTADHGFTFGPPPANETRSRRKIDGAHRCIEVSSPIDDADLSDESLTCIDKDIFHLRNNYLAARGRYFGSGSVSGWALSHGGLLPEEVIIPVVQWFGDEIIVLSPEVDFPEGASRDRDRWVMTIRVRNVHPVPIFGIILQISVLGESQQSTKSIACLRPNDTTSFTAEITSAFAPASGESVPVNVTMILSASENGRHHERVRQYAVPKAKQFIIRTTEQADFENMF